MKWLIIILMVLMLPIILADEGFIERYDPKQVFDLNIHLTNKTGDVTGANCNTQIRNESYDVLENLQHNEINGGWYNLTYNTSRTGKYFCRQNCTQGDIFTANTCDFIIKSEEKMAIAIAMLLIFIIIAYLVLVILMSRETFSAHGAIKSGIILLCTWFLLIPMDAAIKINEKAGDYGISGSLETMYIILIYLNIIITIYFIIFIIVGLLRSIRDNLPKNMRGEEN